MPHVDRLIERYLSGKVQTATDRDRLFGHLDRCAKCKEHFDELAKGQRLLHGDPNVMPESELALITGPLLDEMADSRSPFALPSWLFTLVPVAAALVFTGVFFGPKLFAPADVAEYSGSKGHESEAVVALEVLCFSEEMAIETHLSESGECAAPAYLKIIYASAKPVDGLAVGAIAGQNVRLNRFLSKPKPRSVIPDHTTLAPGESVRIVGVRSEASITDEALLELEAALVVKGVAR